jgi:choline dehydrogenase-like flavoprotein
MHTDARELESGSLLEGDICIVGAGAAGISMALEWVNTPYRVILLESGGFEVDAAVQELSRGESVGQRYYPLQSARLRFFGGTTGHWAGFCAPFDPIDFEHRDWVPDSGWPIGRRDLDPFYARAQQVVELGPYEYDLEYWRRHDPEMIPLPLDSKVVWNKMWQFSPPTRFGTRYRDAIVDAPNVHLLTNASVCDIEANDTATRVEQVHVRSLDGKKHTVRAHHYVLASCAIQTARLLLASSHQAPRGLGNDHDLVGRYFMEHPELNTGYLIMPAPAPMKLYMLSFFETPARAELALTAEQQRENRVLNCTVSLTPSELDAETRANIDWFPDDAAATLKLWDDIEMAYRAGQLPKPDPSKFRSYLLFTRLEQAPNRESRITLSEEVDQLGVRRARLNWQLTELDKRTIRRTYEVIGREMGRSGLGRVQLMDWLLDEDDRAWPATLGGGWHHMGTTRMHEDPKRGVVDANCKVHGVSNLHVAGSAVYPTGGAANPTLTLIALTLRLSDHLKSKVV